jgi:excisionase family DNA binding protein
MENPFETINQRLERIEKMLQGLQPTPQVPQAVNEEIMLDEASELTGLKKSTIYRLSFAGEIPVRRRGKRLIFSRSQLNQWIEDRTVTKRTPRQIAAEELAEEIRGRK